ncbi:MAG: hypothetical protein Q9191_005261 [Dirinaria sp. TL-2023a]
MATPQAQPNLSPGFLAQSYRPSLYSAAFITYTLATSAVILRFVARRLRHLDLWYDDWLCVVAWLVATGFFIDELIWIHLGLGVHYQIIPASYSTIAHNILLNLFVEDFFYATVTSFVKLSLLAFYRRIFNVPSIRWPIWIMAPCVVSWLLARYISLILHCIPVQAYWDKSIQNATCRVNDRKWFLGTVTVNFFMDLIVLILPMLYIKKLQVERSKKIAVGCMFTFGGFVVAISVILLVVCSRLDPASPDVSWTISPIVIWAGTEINLSVVTSCLPSLRPIYLLVTKGTANPGPKKVPRQFTDSSTLKNKALATFGSKGRTVKSYPGMEPEDEGHPFTRMRDNKCNEHGHPASHDSNIDLEEQQPPQDRVLVREDIFVKYSNV